ncbi:uncharacterized protein [Euwallacea similis]|uniref:uncharacterized protein isoform X1 n=1 Tax=Euwallacea similis TaxID=1736056 RepID=UPI00344D9BD3
MDLIEDSYRLNQVFPHLMESDIIGVLRNTDNCYEALVQLCKMQPNVPNPDLELESDKLCLFHIFATTDVEQREITDWLHIFASLPNRKEVVCRYLCLKLAKTPRQRPSEHLDEPKEAGSSKQIKVADSTEESSVIDIQSEESAGEGHSNLSVVIRKDKNGNHYTITTSSSRNKPSSSTQPKSETVIASRRPSSLAKKSKAIHNCRRQAFFENMLQESRDNDKFPNDQIAGPSRIHQHHFVHAPIFTPPPLNKAIILNDSLDDSSISNDGTAVIDLSQPIHESEQNLVGHEAEQVVLENRLIDLPVPALPELTVDENLLRKVMEVFPEACPDYIRAQCRGKVWCPAAFAEVVEVILGIDYPRRPTRVPSPDIEVDPREQLATMKAVLPNADPSYLEKKFEEFGGDKEALRQFVEHAMETHEYPTLKEYLRKKQLSAQQRQYTTDFNVERFVEIFPDPVSVFEDPNRKSPAVDESDKYYVKCFMRTLYSQLYVKDVNAIVDQMYNKNLMLLVNQLDKIVFGGHIKKTRNNFSPKWETQNIPLLQELAYFEHKNEILKFLQVKKQKDAEERKYAKELGLLQSCGCCFDEEVMPTDILTCQGGCRFCRDCIKRSTEVAFSESKTNYPCLSAECQAEFSLQVLQNVLAPKLFSKLAQKKALAEVKAAGVDDLETCPFCEFANIPPPEDKLFRCLNPDCMKESCRLCKEPSHVPLRCDEVEKDEAVKARTYIENKMTEALIRECWKCGAKFIKEEGCNKMTCSCGAMMCYVCRKPVTDYKHFNGQGGDRHDLCPLYTENAFVNEKNVLKAAEEAKKQVDPAQLKNDPTADLDKHFGNKIKDAEARHRQMQHRVGEMHQRFAFAGGFGNVNAADRGIQVPMRGHIRGADNHHAHHPRHRGRTFAMPHFQRYIAAPVPAVIPPNLNALQENFFVDAHLFPNMNDNQF